MRSRCAVLALLNSLIEGANLGPAEFARLMNGIHGDVRDLSFVHEGWMRGVRPGESIEDDMRAGAARRVGGMNYQGGYTFRADGATRLDCYVDYTNDNKEHKSFSSRKLEVILGSKRTSVDQMPEERNEEPTTGGGGAGALNHTCSAERINYSWFFRTLTDPASKRYEFLGWEDISGHRCLKVQFDEVWGLPDEMANRPTIRFWIDMERGGHPLQVEFRRGDRVRMRTGDIELERVPSPDGSERWFPTRGATYLYPFPGPGYVDRPVGYETYKVLDGTVRFNQNLPDAFFTLDWKGAVPENEQLATRRKEFRKPPRRYDPEGIKQYLEKQVAEANEQSTALEAPSAAREPWNWIIVGQAGFAALGAVTLLSVGIWKWKQG